MEPFRGMLAEACSHVKPLPLLLSADRAGELVFFELFTFVGGQSRTGPAAPRRTTLGRVPPSPRGDLALQMHPFFFPFWVGVKLRTVGPESAFEAS